MPFRLGCSREAGDPGIAKLNSALMDLTLERENLLVTLTPQHPQIRDLDARIAATRENLDARIRATRENVIRELRVKSANPRGSGRRAAADRSSVSARNSAALPDLSRQYAQLQRELTFNETLQSTLRSKLQEVQIKEREQVEEVSLVRPATAPGAPTNPPQTDGQGHRRPADRVDRRFGPGLRGGVPGHLHRDDPGRRELPGGPGPRPDPPDRPDQGPAPGAAARTRTTPARWRGCGRS